MPFKTRKQKESAAARRFTFSDGRISISNIEDQNMPSGKIHRQESVSGLEKEDNLYLKKDLLKIVILSLLLIGAQVALRLTLS